MKTLAYEAHDDLAALAIIMPVVIFLRRRFPIEKRRHPEIDIVLGNIMFSFFFIPSVEAKFYSHLIA
jgi:hypothetical protein